MKVRNKISRRAQVISAAAVALVFGGGWLAVWKWPHIRLRYRIVTAPARAREVMAARARTMSLPPEVESDQTRIDLGLLSFSVPGTIRLIERCEKRGVYIETETLSLDIPELMGGRTLASNAQSDGQLRLLRSDNRWESVGFMTYCQAAHRASTADFRWGLTFSEVCALEQFLFFKSLHSEGSWSETYVFEGNFSKGVVTQARGLFDGSGGSNLSIWVSALDDRDCAILYLNHDTQTGIVNNLLASIRFPTPAFGDAPELIERKFAAVMELTPRQGKNPKRNSHVSTQSSSGPAQP